jgi:PAS domain S-box-containing protein
LISLKIPEKVPEKAPEGVMQVERIWQDENRTRVLAISFAIIVLIAVVDWRTPHFLALGFLYMFPIMSAARFLPRWLTALLGIACGTLAEVFSYLEPSFVRTAFVCLALAGSGLFAGELFRNRRLSLESQEQLRALVETSPAAIVIVDQSGFIELANCAALQLMLPRDKRLIGQPVAAFLPDLHHALRWEDAPQFRAAMQCKGHRGDGKAFTAHVWFSTYRQGEAPKVAAIIADVMEDEAPGRPEVLSSDASSPLNISEQPRHGVLNDRETEVLKLLVQGLTNKQIAVRLSISESAVKNAMQQLFAKTGVRARSQLVRVALQEYRNIL